jgi:uncharacterized protein YbbK (DUF523 family)
MAVVVSACLLGENCKWDGGNNRNERVIAFCAGKEVIPVCPEVAGGLPVPRAPSEIREGRVTAKDGADVDAAFRMGAQKSLALCEEKTIELAILKARSPSCGKDCVYDGSFSGALVPGDGVFAAMLKERGIPVFTEAEEWTAE